MIEGDVFDVLHTRHNLHCDFVFVDAHAYKDGRQAFGEEIKAWFRHLSTIKTIMMWESETKYFQNAIEKHFLSVDKLRLLKTLHSVDNGVDPVSIALFTHHDPLACVTKQRCNEIIRSFVTLKTTAIVQTHDEFVPM